MTKGKLIYKSMNFKMSIYLDYDDIIFINSSSGYVRTFKVQKVINDMFYDNKHLYSIYILLVFYIVVFLFFGFHNFFKYNLIVSDTIIWAIFLSH